MRNTAINRSFIWATFFSIAMAFVESAVVIYLREIMYPRGFSFPLAPIEQTLALTEIIREAATLIMLLSFACLAGKDFPAKFAYFLYCFALWDIFYYVFLKLLLGWPESLMTWDILFLIPVSWVGPVVAPLIVSLIMIAFALSIFHFSRKKKKPRIVRREWMLLILGSLFLIVAFSRDYTGFMLENFSVSDLVTGPREELFRTAQRFVPQKFNWWLYSAGLTIILAGIGLFISRNRSDRSLRSPGPAQ